jgi:hypothetical protein
VALFLNGWAGDHAGGVVGRKPNTLLIAMTLTEHSRYPRGLDERARFGRTTAVYPFWRVDCLTPNANEALVTNATETHNTWEIEVAEVDWEDNRDSWAPGVHLFGVQLYDGLSGFSTAIATAVINEDVTRLDPKKIEVSEIWGYFTTFLRERHKTTPRPDWP